MYIRYLLAISPILVFTTAINQSQELDQSKSICLFVSSLLWLLVSFGVILSLFRHRYVQCVLHKILFLNCRLVRITITCEYIVTLINKWIGIVVYFGIVFSRDRHHYLRAFILNAPGRYTWLLQGNSCFKWRKMLFSELERHTRREKELRVLVMGFETSTIRLEPWMLYQCKFVDLWLA